MTQIRNVIAPIAGACLAGAMIGLAEAGWLARSGIPDLWAFPYAVLLYSALAAPLGVVGLIVITLLRRWLEISIERAFSLGAVAGFAPLALAILLYVVNKEVYAEQGVALVGKIAIAAILFAISTLVITAGPAMVRGPLWGFVHPAGAQVAIGVLAASTALVAALFPAPDARLTWSHGKPASAALASKPDIILIMVDTLRADHLGAYGGAVPTPAFDALARDSVLFENAFANASWTRASGASLFTSKLPSGHATATKAARLPDEEVTFGELLQAGGLTTGALINNINLSETFHFDQGFDTFIYEAPEYRFAATESVFGLSMYKVIHKVAEKVLGKHKEVERFYQPAEVVLRDAEGFLAANQQGRVALFVHLMEPHDPYFEHPVIEGTGNDEYNGVGFARAERERPDVSEAEHIHHLYNGEVAFLDKKLAPFLKALRDSGQYDRSLIVITADHGEEFAEHGGFWHGTTLYDEQVHVPLIVKLPRQELAGTRVPWQVRSIDIAPTMAAAVGLAADPSWMGKDLVGDVRAWQAPVVEGAAPRDFERPVIAEEDFEGNQLSALRKQGFHWMTANAGNPRGLAERQLFDVHADRAEVKNLVGSGAAVRGQYPDDVARAWDSEMIQVIGAAKKGAAAGSDATFTDADRQSLCALGYIDCEKPPTQPAP